MKKALSFLLLGIIFITSVVTSAFSYFNFNDTIDIDSITVSGENAKFNEVESDFYKVYFFASPYYATGATIGNKEIDNPLKIAESGTDNPYNQDEGYGLICKSPLPSSIADRYENITFKDSNDKFFVSAESIDEEKLGNYGAIKLWPKKYWTGYILANPNYGIYERTSTYVSLTVNSNIPSDILSDIVAQTVFKDQYGFGPEFIGWTYDKEACNSRVRYNGNRYLSNSDMRRMDSRGYKIAGSDCIGNYGVQGEITQITSSDSLYYIDNLGLNGSLTSDKSIDGSKKGDHIIYLYPVFMAKNYNTSKKINNVSTPIAKIRFNPEIDENGNYTYDTKQSGEVDYSKNRFTAGFFQTTSSDIKKPNYYVNDIFLDTTNSASSRIKDMRLDINPVVSSSDWAEHWSTILDFDDFKNLGLEKNYYNIYISLWQASFNSNNVDEELETAKVLDVIETFKSTNKYIKIIGSTRDDNATYGIKWLKKYNNVKSDMVPICYVIGIQKVEEYRITSNSLNGSINDFNSAGRKRLYRTSIVSEGKEFFISDSISLRKGDEFSILIDGETTSSIPYSFTSMSNELLNYYNNSLLLSSHTNKTPFISVDDGQKINLSSTDGKINKMVCNDSGIYGILLAIDYKDGLPSTISLSFRELDASYFMFILKSKPETDFFLDYDELMNSDKFLAVATFNLFTPITTSSVFQGRGEATSIDITIQKIHSLYPSMSFIDTATGWEIPYSLFESGQFILNRNYVLYLK